MGSSEQATIGLIGGIGQASAALEQLPPVRIATPYGPTSTPIRFLDLHGRRVAVITRRGNREQLPPHRVPHRANLWALASLGVTAVVANSASTGLHPSFTPGSYVIPDKVLDFSSGRADTFFDEATENSAIQVPTSSPFEPILCALAGEALQEEGVRVRDFGTIAISNGPRFPSEAETQFYASAGAHLTNMTAMPETVLARELGIGVVHVSLITDHADSSLTDQSHPQALDLIRMRAAQAQPTLLRALARLVQTIPDSYRAPQHTPSTTRQQLLEQDAR